MIFDLTNTSEERAYMVGEKQFDYKLNKKKGKWKTGDEEKESWYRKQGTLRWRWHAEEQNKKIKQL